MLKGDLAQELKELLLSKVMVLEICLSALSSSMTLVEFAYYLPRHHSLTPYPAIINPTNATTPAKPGRTSVCITGIVPGSGDGSSSPR